MDMQTAIEFFQPIATKESLTALGLLTAILIGYKAAQRGCTAIGGFAKKAPYKSLSMAVFALAGASTFGLGVGEIASRWASPEPVAATPEIIVPGMQNDELQELVETFNGHTNPEAYDKTLDYVSRRDGISAKLSDEMLEKFLDKTTEANASVAGKILDIYKSREERLHANGEYDQLQQLDDKTAAISLKGPTILTSYSPESENVAPATPLEDGTVEQEVAEVGNKDSIMNLPSAFGMIFSGLIGMIGSVIMLRRKDPETPVAGTDPVA